MMMQVAKSICRIIKRRRTRRRKNRDNVRMGKVQVDNNNLSKGGSKVTDQVSQSVTISNAGMTSLHDHRGIPMPQGASKSHVSHVIRMHQDTSINSDHHVIRMHQEGNKNHVNQGLLAIQMHLVANSSLVSQDHHVIRTHPEAISSRVSQGHHVIQMHHHVNLDRLATLMHHETNNSLVNNVIRTHQEVRKTEINKVADKIATGIGIVTVTRGRDQKAESVHHKTIQQNDI